MLSNIARMPFNPSANPTQALNKSGRLALLMLPVNGQNSGKIGSQSRQISTNSYAPQTLQLNKDNTNSFKNWYKSSPLAKVNPYIDFNGFKSQVADEVQKETIPSFIKEIGATLDHMRNAEEPSQRVLKITNCPVDDVLPKLTSDNPIQERRDLKKSFVGESFLMGISTMADMPILGYTTRNDGEMFQDVKSIKKYDHTQTQKTAHALSFHNDRTAHPVRADYLMLLGLTVPKENALNTTYIDKNSILPQLSQEDIQLLSEESFTTPFDDLSKNSNTDQNTNMQHSIIYDNGEKIRFYANRTQPSDSASDKTKAAFENLLKAIDNAPIAKTVIGKDELFIFPNVGGLHSRELTSVTNQDKLHDRWILKTYNYKDTATAQKHEKLFDSNTFGLVDDNKVDLL